MLTLMNLEKAGLLGLQGNRVYPTLKTKLKLVVDDVNEQVSCHVRQRTIAVIITCSDFYGRQV